jgi:hypothetical protein
VVKGLNVRHHHTGQYAAVLLAGEEILTNNVISMNVKQILTVHLTRRVLPKNVLIHVEDTLVEEEPNARLNSIELFASVLGAYKETQ